MIVVYCAPCDRPLSALHIAEDGVFGEAFDEPLGATPLTRCGLVMRAAELWVAVERLAGDRVCLGCAGLPAAPRPLQLALEGG